MHPKNHCAYILWDFSWRWTSVRCFLGRLQGRQGWVDGILRVLHLLCSAVTHSFTFIEYLVGFVPCLLSYNLQWWMSWLEHWWRAQRSVISIVNCRIPWINRILNVFCAFGTFLRACLLQSLLLLLPVTLGSSASSVSVCLCVSGITPSFPWHTQCACSCGFDAQHMYWTLVFWSLLLHHVIEHSGFICEDGLNLSSKTWSQTNKPTEFKHISKWRIIN